MTSQKSLRNNVNANDFKRSFIGTLLFPTIAFIVLLVSSTFPLIKYVTSEEFIKTAIHNEVQIFLPQSSIFYYSPELLFVGMVFCGALVAIKSYFFLLSKKQVNVFLSIGVTRNTLFINRTISAIITLFASTFIPIFITYLINVAKFGATAYMTSVFLYFVAALFISGVVGYAIGTFAMTVSGNIFEAGLVGASLSFVPVMAFNCFDVLRDTALKGYMYKGEFGRLLDTLTPFTFVTNFEPYTNGRYCQVRDLIAPIEKGNLVKGEIPEYMLVDKFFTIPIIAWAIVAVVLILVAGLLLNRRKAEHANSFGHFAVSRAIVAIFASSIVLYATIGMCAYDLGIVAVFLISLVAVFATFFLVQIIMARKVKKVFKALPVYAGFMAVAAILFTIIGTEYFGTFNKTPEKEDIKSVAISMNEIDLFYNSVYPSNSYVKSTDSNDIDMVRELFDIIKKDSKKNGEFEAEICFAFEDKEGNLEYRAFRVYSADIFMTYLEKTYSSSFFDALVEEQLLGFNDKNISANGKYSLKTQENEWEYIIYEEAATDEIAYTHYFDNSMLVKAGDIGYDEEQGKTGFSIIKGDDLARALYEDYTKMTFDELFRNNQKPVATLGYVGSKRFNANDILKPSVSESDKYMYAEETMVYGEYSDKVVQEEAIVRDSTGMVLIYPQMTNTIEYFKENPRDFEYQYDGKIKEIYYSDLSFSDAAAKFTELNESRFSRYGGAFISRSKVDFFRNYTFSDSHFRYLMDYITEDTNNMTLLKDVFETAESPLKPIDKSKHQSVIDNTVPYYLTYKDSGKYIYFLYEDGTMSCLYLPQANVNVLK